MDNQTLKKELINTFKHYAKRGNANYWDYYYKDEYLGSDIRFRLDSPNDMNLEECDILDFTASIDITKNNEYKLLTMLSYALKDTKKKKVEIKTKIGTASEIITAFNSTMEKLIAELKKDFYGNNIPNAYLDVIKNNIMEV